MLLDRQLATEEAARSIEEEGGARRTQVACGEVLHGVGLAEPAGLGALAGAGGTEKEEAGFHRGSWCGRWWLAGMIGAAAGITGAPDPRSAGRSHRSAPAWPCRSPRPPGSAVRWHRGPGRSARWWRVPRLRG